jgi:hypothetical protein
MGQYTAPLRDMRFVFHELLDAAGEYRQLYPGAELTRDLIDQVLEEGAKFASEVLFPLNAVGDKEGCRLEGSNVVTPPGF